MLKKLKRILFFIVLPVFVLWVASSLFSYFTHSVVPEIRLVGLQKDGYYAKKLSCNIKSDNSYKIAKLNIFLDGKKIELRNDQVVRTKKFNIPFKFDISGVSNGKHILEIEAVDGSYNRNKSVEKWPFYVDNISVKAVFLQQEYKVDQGRTIHVRIQANKQLEKIHVKFLEDTYNCYPESNYSNVYECFIPIECEQNSGEYMMESYLKDFVKNIKNDVTLLSKVVVNTVKFPKQHGFKIPEGKLEEEKEISMSDKILEEALEKWVKDSPKKKLWRGHFEIPINMKRIATPFGEIRTTPEKGRYLHRAVDILDSPKSVVWASQDGKVIIRDRFLKSGNTVVLDHGLGVFTLYFHLDDFSNVEVGDFIKKGNPIGKLGMTGYATGYHLHWELRVKNVPVDPFQWIKKSF